MFLFCSPLLALSLGTPGTDFFHAFGVMNRFPITYNILYLGKFIKSTAVPWHYIPVWILITTPMLFTLFFLIGAFGRSGVRKEQGQALFE